MFECEGHWPNAAGRGGQASGAGGSLCPRCLPQAAWDLAGYFLGLGKQHLALFMVYVAAVSWFSVCLSAPLFLGVYEGVVVKSAHIRAFTLHGVKGLLATSWTLAELTADPQSVPNNYLIAVGI